MKRSTKLFSLVLAMVMVFSLMTACTTGGSAGTTSTPPASSATTSTPKPADPAPVDPKPADPAPTTPKRDDINLALTVVGVTLDPHNSGQQADKSMTNQIYDGLVFANEATSEVTPAIAESWEVSPDGMKYTFKIRQGIKFHNGDILTSQDVKFSLERAMGSTHMASSCSSIDSVSTPDANTVIVFMKQPFNAFLQYLSLVRIVCERVVKEQGENFGGNAVDAGCGPYVLKYYDRSAKLELEAFEDYYLGEPAIKYAHIHVITDSSSVLTAFKAGDIDYSSIPAADFNDLKNSGKYTTELVPTAMVRFFGLNPTNPDSPLYNKKVRQAIQYAIDKELVLEIANEGFGVIADHMMRVGMLQGAVETSWNYTYDIAKAKQLLAEAGYPNGCNIGTISVGQNENARIAQVIQEQLKEIGITCDIQQGVLSNVLVDWRAANYDAFSNAINATYSYDSFRNYNNFKHATSFMKYDRNPEIDHEKILQLFLDASATTDVAEMNAMYKELEEMLMDAACWVPLYYAVQRLAWDPDLNATGFVVNYRINDWSWK